MKKWAKEEVNFLKENYSDKTNLELSKVLNRSISAIQHKCTQLGLNKSKEHISKTWSKVRRGEKSSSWKGGRKINKKGHVLVLKKGHPLADKNGYVLEHRYIMCRHLGRILCSDEIVHHKNGIKTDNRIENLEIMTNAEHTMIHHIGKKRSIATRRKISEAKRKKVDFNE